MPTLRTRGTKEFLAKLQKDKAKILGKVTETHQRLVYAILVDLVTLTPQWSGNLASNWQLEFHSYSARYRELQGKKAFEVVRGSAMMADFAPYQKGDDPAVSIALDREVWKIPQIRWNSKVKITNPTSYASDVNEGRGPLSVNGQELPIRDVNLHPAYGGVAMVGFIDMKYNKLTNLRRLKAVPK